MQVTTKRTWQSLRPVLQLKEVGEETGERKSIFE